MKEPWKALAGGALSIIAGALSVAAGLLLLVLGGTLSGVLATLGVPDLLYLVPFPVFAGFTVPLFILGLVAIVGGAYAVRRRNWPLALAGAMCALFSPHVGIFGMLAIVFIVMGKNEFD